MPEVLTPAQTQAEAAFLLLWGLGTTWTDIVTVGGIEICPPLRLKPSRMLEMGALRWNCPSLPV